MNTNGMTPPNRAEYQLIWVPLRHLSVVWASAQRSLQQRHVDEIAEHWDASKLDPIVVTCPLKDKMRHVADGQHRVMAARALFSEEDKLPCLEYPTTSPAEAARLFRTRNKAQRPISVLEDFLVGVTARDPECVAVKEIIDGLGYRVAKSSDTEGVIQAAGTCLRVYRRHGEEGLTWALGTIQETWGMDPDAVKGWIIDGFARLLKKHRGVLDRNRLVKVLSRALTPNRLVAQARSTRDLHKGSMPDNIVRVIEMEYNSRLRTGARLEQ